MKNAREKKEKPRGDAAPRHGAAAFVRLVETVFRFIHACYPEFTSVLEKHDVNYSQYAALLTVYMYGSLTEGELARLIHVNPSTMSRMLHALERKGWLQAARDPADRRRVTVTLSPWGRRRVGEMIGGAAEVMVGLTERLPAREKEGVYGVVELIDRTLQRLMEIAD